MGKNEKKLHFLCTFNDDNSDFNTVVENIFLEYISQIENNYCFELGR
ncbi:MAG: hypothetical protein IJW20_07435 [Clostridia bacterium]|nr:hypothetical protein [Clostridia bacterium]